MTEAERMALCLERDGTPYLQQIKAAALIRKQDAALRLALECLVMIYSPLNQDKFDKAIAAIQEQIK